MCVLVACCWLLFFSTGVCCNCDMLGKTVFDSPILFSHLHVVTIMEELVNRSQSQELKADSVSPSDTQCCFALP